MCEEYASRWKPIDVQLWKCLTFLNFSLICLIYINISSHMSHTCRYLHIWSYLSTEPISMYRFFWHNSYNIKMYFYFVSRIVYYTKRGNFIHFWHQSTIVERSLNGREKDWITLEQAASIRDVRGCKSECCSHVIRISY